jgi:hypothetical protein
MAPPENTSSAPRSLQAAELRTRVGQLRRELLDTTNLYHTARERCDHTQVMLLLRKRTQLVRQLFQVQSELLLVFRAGEPTSHSASDQGQHKRF